MPIDVVVTDLDMRECGRRPTCRDLPEVLAEQKVRQKCGRTPPSDRPYVENRFSVFQVAALVARDS